MHGTEEASNDGKVKVRIIHGLTLVIKNSYTYCKRLLALEAKYYYACCQGMGWQELTIARSRPPLIRKAIKRASHATNLLHNFYHTCMLQDLPTSTQVFINFIVTQLAHLQYYHLYISKQLSSIQLLLAFKICNQSELPCCSKGLSK